MKQNPNDASAQQLAAFQAGMHMSQLIKQANASNTVNHRPAPHNHVELGDPYTWDALPDAEINPTSFARELLARDIQIIKAQDKDATLSPQQSKLESVLLMHFRDFLKTTPEAWRNVEEPANAEKVSPIGELYLATRCALRGLQHKQNGAGFPSENVNASGRLQSAVAKLSLSKIDEHNMAVGLSSLAREVFATSQIQR